jgi:hypothetical protein
MTTVQDVTDWMLRELQKDGHLCYQYALRQIVERFGKRFSVVDKQSQLAIARDVLQEFRNMIAGYAVWDPRRREWRRVRHAQG